MAERLDSGAIKRLNVTRVKWVRGVVFWWVAMGLYFLGLYWLLLHSM